jgi:hypothetical protein
MYNSSEVCVCMYVCMYVCIYVYEPPSNYTILCTYALNTLYTLYYTLPTL